LLDVAFPKEFENLVSVRGERKGRCGGGTMVVHDSFVVRYLDRVVFLDAVDEDLTNPFHGVLHRQAEESRKTWVVDILLEEERPGLKGGREIDVTATRIR